MTLALEIRGATVIASDLSTAALAVAAANARAHGVEDRLSLVAADLVAPFDPARVDLVVSNPPYIDPAELAALSIEVSDFEPQSALCAPEYRDSILERLFRELRGFRPGTPILLEIGYDQAQRTARLAGELDVAILEIRTDLAGHPRVSILSSR